MLTNDFGIYVHIPFCVSKCEYCSFISKCASEEEIQKYINFLCEEIKYSAIFYKDKIVSSIYFGGGTPSFINSKHIKTILEELYKNYQITDNAEISIECNPCSTTKAKLTDYKNAGINRISFGVQSLENNELKELGRSHTKDMAISAISKAKEVGFQNISCDLMIGIPNQTKDSLINSAKTLISLGITHISAYMLILEEGTKIFEKVKNKKIKVASDDESVELYNSLILELEKNDINRYEISNFSKMGYECKHNINYWDMGEYLGFGVASHSFVCGTRLANCDDFEKYYQKVKKLKNDENLLKNHEKSEKNNDFLIKNIKNYYESFEILSNSEIIEETIMLGLRQEKGVSITKLKNLGYDIINKKGLNLNNLLEANIIKIENDYIKINPEHFGVCSAVVLELIP